MHLYSSFPIDPQNFPRGANLYQKLPFLAILGSVRPHFQSYNGQVWHGSVVLGLPPQTKFCKNRLKGYTPFGENYTNNYQFWVILAAVSPRCNSENGKIWQGVGLGLPPPGQTLYKLLKGIYLLYANLYQKLTILEILVPVSPHF